MLNVPTGAGVAAGAGTATGSVECLECPTHPYARATGKVVQPKVVTGIATKLLPSLANVSCEEDLGSMGDDEAHTRTTL